MSNDKSPNFFEPRTLLAFGLTMIVFVLWQNHMKKKYPQIYSAKPKVEKQDVNLGLGETKETIETPPQKAATVTSTAQLSQAGADQAFTEEFFFFESEKWTAKVSNLGLEFRSVQLKAYKGRTLDNVIFNNLFKTSFFGLSDPIPFQVTQTGDQIIGVYDGPNGRLKKIMKFNPLNYSVAVSYEIQGNFPGLSTYMDLPINEGVRSSFLMPSFERQEFVVINAEGEDRDLITAKDFASRSFDQVKLVSLGSQFFSKVILDRSTLKPSAILFSDNANKSAIARLDYEFSKDLKSFFISQTYFAGPKDDVILKSVDRELMTLINFGMFKIICEPILNVLKFFYSKFSNYGVAIILLTLLMRLLVFPIAYRGYKSMEKMQKIQPMLKELREKHKDDPQKANLATMALMKEHKVNPVGGCLPMLLQLPIFFAFYRVLSESIVMYQAPFALWITDLSLKDPYYVLPVLMGATMFVQQKLTPTALEPMQQRVMLFIPVIFSVFMISLPSALTLYIFVSTLFGVLQQYLFTKSK